jgi:transcription initiation factor TFIID TATA-box-binding protein
MEAGNLYIPQLANNLALPGPSPLSNSFTLPQDQRKQVTLNPPNPIAVPSLPSTAPAPVTVAPSATTAGGPSSPLTLEQQHITQAAVERIVPTLQNIVATQVSTQVYSSCTSDTNGSIQDYLLYVFFFLFHWEL